MSKLTIALPKGRLFTPVVNILQQAGIVSRDFSDDSRKLVLTDEENQIDIILSKAVDVQTYVENGVADIGVAGKDILLEAEANICEMLDLGIGGCRLVVALPEDRGITDLSQLPPTGRVATKYINVAQKYFDQQGIQIEVVKLNGSIELAPIIGLSDMIVDITSTGTTLRENNLIEIAEIAKSSARVIVNQVSYKAEYSRIKEIVEGIKRVISEKSSKK
ncbi:ATP phosphoribosyltransferase [Orenia marismortui]|uniref:ATP phosphoribosyltransferase n=1 Tax=Orenia marismortui TaxID=46469 RepID=A0A4R8GLP2_9FIRM|nr:ATP phosphoribosyltransferase [Orenia marismortui]TDX46602.1 ATP phosphoribosyltransferase catalytic subunit [Orenia marismortui]